MHRSILDYALEADRIIGSGGPDFDAFSSIAETFDQAVAAQAHVASLHELVRRMGEGLTDVTPDISSGPFVVLYSSPMTTWAILLHRRRNASIFLNPTHSISSPIAGSAIDALVYATDRPIEFSVMDPSARLVEDWATLNSTSGHVLKDGRSEALDIQPAGAGIAFTLRVNSAAFGAFEWSFDRRTGAPKRVTSISNAHSNVESILDLIAAVGSQSSIDVVEPFLSHSAHHVRWKAVQTIGRLAPERRERMAASAANDPHPHVRLAANATLQRLGQ